MSIMKNCEKKASLEKKLQWYSTFSKIIALE